MAGPLIAVWSPKGGVGKTLISVGLAMHLNRRISGGAILIDLDAGKADIAPLLKTATRPSILEYTADFGQTVVHPHGLQLVPGPVRLTDAPLVTAEVAQAAFKRARESAGVVVADLDSDLRDSTIVGLEEASVVLMVTTPDLLSIYACRRFVQEAELVGMSLAKFRLVINQAPAGQEIPDSEILSLIGVALAGRIPLMPGLSLAINRGMITTAGRSNTEFGVAIQRIAERLGFAGLTWARETARADAAAAKVTAGAGTGAVVRSRRRESQAPVAGTGGFLEALKRWWQAL